MMECLPLKNLGVMLLSICFTCCCSVPQSCLTPCNPMDGSTPCFPVLHHLLEFAQTHIHWVADATIPPSVAPFSCPPSFPASGSFLMSQFHLLELKSSLVDVCLFSLESPLDSNEIRSVNPKGNQPRIFIGRTDVEAEAPILWPLVAKSRLIG